MTVTHLTPIARFARWFDGRGARAELRRARPSGELECGASSCGERILEGDGHWLPYYRMAACDSICLSVIEGDHF